MKSLDELHQSQPLSWRRSLKLIMVQSLNWWKCVSTGVTAALWFAAAAAFLQTALMLLGLLNSLHGQFSRFLTFCLMSWFMAFCIMRASLQSLFICRNDGLHLESSINAFNLLHSARPPHRFKGRTLFKPTELYLNSAGDPKASGLSFWNVSKNDAADM